MADAYVQIPVDGVGKKIRTSTKTVGADTVHVHFWIKDGVAFRYIDAGGGTEYVGEGLPGASTASAEWRIKRITTSGSSISSEWADGNDAFDNIWDNYASLTYL